MVFFLSYDTEGTRDTFIFTDPVYTSEADCRATLTDKFYIMNYVHRMMLAYNGVLPGSVEIVNCITEDQFNELKKLKDKQEGKIRL